VPTTEQHLTQARNNERLALAWEETDPEWAVTALFYAALHYVDAFFSRYRQINHIPGSFPNHQVRTREVYNRLNFVYEQYQRLLDRSRDARYDCIRFDARRVQRLRDNDLLQIKQYIETQLRSLS